MTTNNVSVQEYLTKQEVADLLRKSTKTIDTWVRLNGFPCIKIGRSVLYPRAGLNRFLENLSLGGVRQ